jgi:Fur family transcriptional regulator, iron response regulator
MDIARDFRVTKILAVLREAGLRPTRQRVALAHILFDHATTRHITAEQVFAAAQDANVCLSLATVYNTLHQFTKAGLLREVTLEPGRVHYDSNVTQHHHLVTSDGDITCVDANMISFNHLPELPAGEVLDRIEVVIWTRKSAS